MKKIISIICGVIVGTSAFAHGHNDNLITGLVVGGIVASQLAPRQPVYVPQPYPVYQQPRYESTTNIYYPRQPVKSCVMYPVYDQYGVAIGQQNVCDYR